jgi:hypothetical protein
MLYYIYCIWVKTEEGVLRYYGHTENMTVRKGKHVAKHKAWVAAGRPEKVSDVYATRSVYVLEYEDWRMDVKATVEHEDKEKAKEMARDKEGEFILENDCVNMCVAGRTKKEWHQDHKEERNEISRQYYETHKQEQKQYRQDHKEKYSEYMKKYKQDHRDEIAAKQKEKVTCEVCCSVVRKSDISTHQKTKKCIAAKLSQPITTNAITLSPNP